jgi:CelD/BcsL family acetyltransferase involved in cellulose biosynthesis
LSSDWSALAEQAGNLFATPEWLGLWWEHCGPGGEFPVEMGGGVVLPVYVWRSRPARVARFLGHGAGDELGPLCAPGEEAAAAEALHGWLGEHRVDLLVGEQLPAGRWRELLGGERLTEDGSPVLRFEGVDWEAYLATRSRNFRSLVRRAEKKALALPGARYRLANDSDRLPGDLDALFDLHRRRWPEGSNFASRESFHRAFAAIALERGWLRLWLLEADGAPVAAWYGFRFAGAEHYYQAGRDPDFEQASVGLALLAHTVREAQQDGLPEYRFLRGGEDFKYRFADDDPGLETIGVARSLRGRAALAVARFSRAAARRLRRSR